MRSGKKAATRPAPPPPLMMLVPLHSHARRPCALTLNLNQGPSPAQPRWNVSKRSPARPLPFRRGPERVLRGGGHWATPAHAGVLTRPVQNGVRPNLRAPSRSAIDD